MKHIVGARPVLSHFAGPRIRSTAQALVLLMIVAALPGVPLADAGSEPPADPNAYAAWKLSLIGIDATAPEAQPTAPAAPTGDGLLIPFESGGWTPLPATDDGSTGALPLGFNFAFYGTTWPSVFVNNNGNITFGEPFGTFSPSGFPSTAFSMIAPFWADVDTRCEGCGLVYYKFETARDQSWRRFVAHWDDVGRFDMQPGLGNTFQVVISNGNDPLLGSGNNVCLSYGDMQWTTGDASRGMDGFGGDPATVGANRGDGVTFFQYGRFDHEGMDYDGPGGLADGVSFLDGQTICFSTAQGLNVPPVVTGLPDNNTYDVRVGETLDASLSFLSGELNQVTTVTVDPGGLGNFTSMSVPGNPATVQFLFSPTAGQAGDNFVFVAATDDGGPPQTTNLALNFRVQSDCGNGELNPGEACDDGNSTPGDGCRADCTVEVCGDGILDPQEDCDDGNNTPGDGCRTDCTLEVCGDGTVDTGEGCDDGNNDDGDGCDAECNIEPSCGDGQVDGPDETCDPPGSSSGAPNECRADCTFCGDGNLDTVMEPVEFVVDGGLDSWSGGRPAGWTVERNGGTVMEALDSFSGRAALQLVRENGGVLRVWQDVGGLVPGREHSLSFRFKTRGGVAGNNPLVQIRNMRTMEWLHADGSWGLTQGDALRGGVSADDVWERFQVAFAVPDHHLGTDVFRVALWHGGSGLAPIDHFYDAVSLKRAAVVGPGIEQCDDGNNESGDGCRADCTVEVCGDGIRDSGEECDDGNGDVGDGCRPDCSAEVCGDGIEDPAEECDDGNAGLGDGCRPDCTAERCGDSVEDPGEECDDGNTDDGDGCDAACALEGTETCGDGRLNQPGETCEPPGSNAGLPNECRDDCTFCGDGVRDMDVVDLIQDGGLESWAPETPGRWNTEPSAGEVMLNQAEAFAGDSCAQLVRHTDGVLRIWQDIDGFLPGRTYELRLRFKVRGGVNGNNPLVQIRNMHTMDWLHANGTWQSGLGDALRGGATLDDTWESFAVRFATPITQDPADRLRLALWHGNAALVGVDHFYDAVAVIGPLGPGSEECDDGNNDSGDGCRADCTFEECGDGILDPGEACDDGFDNNDETPDACRSDCVLPSCGDGVRDSGEECDDSNNVDGDGCSATCGISRCGDGDLDPGEQCDDGNREPGDGCRADCTLEVCGDGILDAGEACDDGLGNSDDLADSCRTNCWLPSCGDGTVDSGEYCDDGNNEPGDGCRADCTLTECGDAILDPGEDCDDGNNEPGDGCRADCTVEECGDAILDPGEDCDDGNNEPGDGCRADCTVEECGDAMLDPGEDCDDGNNEPGDGCRADCTVEECGDAILDPDEDCDDGNNEPDDGCRADCTIEECGDAILDPGEDCDDGNNEPGDGCRADCTVEECGDAILDPGEDCDDGNNEPGDGCRADCTVEECGDAMLDPGEDCDDGNNEPGDGCRADCTVEECGDAILDPDEDCDDGNNEPDDGCRADCTIEECGDAILDPGEDCDDGNNEPGDGCRADCTVEECGDTILDPGEDCDDGNNEPGDGCRADCTIEECGDGIRDRGEECDDGNSAPGDGCRADCTVEECGDGILDPGEDCDDGNDIDGDGCAADCRIEEPCELEVVKTCFVEPPVNDGDDDDDDDDDDDCKGSVLAMRLQYTGLGCAATTNSQNGQVTCSGDAAGAGGVRVRVTDRRDDLTYADHEAVYLGDIIQATNIDGGGLMPQTTISIGDGVEEVSLDTSCTQPLSVGDSFGSTRLVGLTTTLGGTVTLPGVGESAETSECVIEPPPPAPHCQKGLKTLTLRYRGGDCAETTNDQRGKVRCWGTSPIGAAVRVRCEGSGAVFADSGRPATLLPGGTIQATAAYAGRMKLPPRLDCSIEDEFGNWRQTVSIKTSCSESLDLGDVFGGLQAYGVDSTGGGPVSLGRAVVYTYLITNKSAVPVFDVTALDSKLGEVPGSPVASIKPDQTVALQARTMISETTTNVVTVMGSTDGDLECPEATDSATVTFDGEDAGECESGLSAVLLRYTGPALLEAATVQVRAGDFRNDPVVFTFPNGLQSGTVLSLASENGFSIDAVAHGELKLGDSTTIVINGIAETLDSSCTTPLVPESAAPLESSALTSSTSWEIVEFVD